MPGLQPGRSQVWFLMLVMLVVVALVRIMDMGVVLVIIALVIFMDMAMVFMVVALVCVVGHLSTF